ncbi:MAG: FtsX-like permease family protein [Acidobacteria bacterium]|nr:FtsX-like permease family protein [Acidobacteriota bacterium]
MNVREVLQQSVQALRANWVRTLLTALGLVIGNASVILVVTISMTSRDYVLEQIRGIGSNLIIAYYEAGNRTGTSVEADFVKIADVVAVREALQGRISAATGVMTVYDQMVIEGKVRDVKIIGSDEQYAPLRNLVRVAGRFMAADDVTLRNRVAMLTEKLAVRLYGSNSNAVGQVVKIQGLQFTIIGSFREKTDSFGLSELSTETILIPMTVLKYLTSEEKIDPMYVQARDAGEVVALTRQVQSILESRHRAGAKYYVDNLTAILDAAESIALILTLVLVLVSAIALLISGIGIMNIMLVTVTERTREIGIRRSVGATRNAVLTQFLAEAVLISMGGGLVGIGLGVAGPWAASYFSGVDIPISPVSVMVAFGTSFLVGLVFGLLPARRAAGLNPTEALRYE